MLSATVRIEVMVVVGAAAVVVVVHLALGRVTLGRHGGGWDENQRINCQAVIFQFFPEISCNKDKTKNKTHNDYRMDTILMFWCLMQPYCFMVSEQKQVQIILFSVCQPSFTPNWIEFNCLPRIRGLEQEIKLGRHQSSCRWRPNPNLWITQWLHIDVKQRKGCDVEQKSPSYTFWNLCLQKDQSLLAPSQLGRQEG